MGEAIAEFEAISNRGKSFIRTPSPLFVAFLEAAKNPYNAQTNPNGIINCGTAENGLLVDRIAKKLVEGVQTMPPSELFYAAIHGTDAFRKKTCELFQRVTEVPLNHENLIAGAGATTLIDGFMACLSDEGDGCIVPTPCYGAIPSDINIRAGLKFIEAPQKPEENFVISIESLEKAYINATEEGTRVRVLLLVNPDNPTGNLMSREQLTCVYEWAKSKRIHIVSDEVYALSVYRGKFVCMLDIAEADKSDYGRDFVHIIWGYSKDFSMSGMRVGLGYTRNSRIRQALEAIILFAGASRQIQYSITGMLNDKEFVESYLADNHAALRAAVQTVTEVLEANQIPYIAPSGGLYITINLSKYMKANTWEAESDLFMHMLKNGLYINPGKSFYFPIPGFFRMIISHPPEILKVALERLIENVNSFKKINTI